MNPIPRIRFAHLPTPIEEMPRLSAALAGPRLFVKRDDQTGLAFGGNKTRKLEFLVADALARGADTLITCGAVQSNHARLTLAAAVVEERDRLGRFRSPEDLLGVKGIKGKRLQKILPFLAEMPNN